MRCWGLAAIGCLASAPAFAQPVDAVTPAPAGEVTVNLGYGAMPGGLHVGSATTLPAGTFAVAAAGGYGFRSGLLGEDHSFTRGIGNLALAYAPTSMLTLAVSFDGRYDKHEGGEDGYVGDPHVMVRVASGGRGKKLRFGGQLGVWLPGSQAPSVVGSAISIDARGFLTVAGFTASAGFRVDNSAKSVESPDSLTAQDRVSLGVSQFHAALAGVRYEIPVGKAFFAVEGSGEIFVGSGAPGPLLRAGAMAGIHLTKQWSALAFVEGAVVPSIDPAEAMANTFALFPYEPLVTGGVGLQGRFGGPRPQPLVVADNPNVVKNPVVKAVEVPEYADVSGEIVDETGKPVVGAKVNVRLKNHTGTGVTDDKGRYKVDRLPIGKTVDNNTTLDDTAAEIDCEVDKKRPAKTTVTLAKGANTIPKLTLEPLLPPGQLRALIRAAGSGKPIPGAVVTVEPGGFTATANAEGHVQIDLPPGPYKVKATAPGRRDQVFDVTVPEGGVKTTNFELP